MHVFHTFTVSFDIVFDDLVDKEVITAVGGAITFVAAYQQFRNGSNGTWGNIINKNNPSQ